MHYQKLNNKYKQKCKAEIFASIEKCLLAPNAIFNDRIFKVCEYFKTNFGAL